MSRDQLGRSLAKARKTADSQKTRHPGSFGQKKKHVTADPDEEDTEEEGLGEEWQLWKLLPHLQSLPEAMVKKLPMAAMFQLNAALGKEQKTTARMGVNTRLAQNAQKLAKRPVQVPSGEDNRKDVLHPARFLGGASCSNGEMWLEAKKIMGNKGITPLGNYDLDSIGCGGSVTPKGWQELHSPGSQELKLKLFHLPNVANSGMSAKKVNLEEGEEALSIGESMREIADLDGFKMALNTAREAMASALPWNRSISAIVSLMLNTNYMQEDLGGNLKRAAILTEFVDYVLGRNALNWENGQAFLSTDELSHVWMNWKGKRSTYFTSKYSEKSKKPGQEKRQSTNDICRKFNANDCIHQKDKECRTSWGKTLKHVCNKYLPGGKVCRKDHSRNDHT